MHFSSKLEKNWTWTVYFMEYSVPLDHSPWNCLFCRADINITDNDGQSFNGRPYYGHIRHQRLQMNIYQRFVFRFLQNLEHVFRFGMPFWIEDINRKRWFAIPYKAMSWRTKLINLEKIAQKLKTWECRIWKHTKKPLWRHQIKIFKIWEKCHLKFCLRSCGPSYIKIGQEL